MAAYPNTAVEAVYRSDWGLIVASLIRLVNDFDLAEEAAQDALVAAVEQWPVTGVPESPRAWIIQTARYKAIDRIRRRRLHSQKLERLGVENTAALLPEVGEAEDSFADERLRLIFTCCHPALSLESQVALTLRTLCGLSTAELARAFLVPESTIAQRLVRAKRKIRDARIPYIVPERDEIPARLDGVMTAIYLVFNEGYAATHGPSLLRTDLCAEAIRLARLLLTLLAPSPPAEAAGLLALMLLQDSRREARYDAAGDLVLLEEQDRTLWDQREIAEAMPLVTECMRLGPGPFALQAAIASVHCRALDIQQTDWVEIARLYELLAAIQPSPVVRLNYSVAASMVEGPAAGLALVDNSDLPTQLRSYHLLHAVRADFLRRLGRSADAAESYRQALDLVTNESERRFLERRLKEMNAGGSAIASAAPARQRSSGHYTAPPDPQSRTVIGRDPSSLGS